jgi:hypothetical protein
VEGRGREREGLATEGRRKRRGREGGRDETEVGRPDGHLVLRLTPRNRSLGPWAPMGLVRNR